MEIPKEVKFILGELNKKRYESYIVGGCVRDLLRGAEPEDWDVATNAKPKEIQKVFPKSFYKNKFLTVTVQTESQNQKLKEIEITTYRSEAKYSDKRHPDEIKFAKTIKEDLSRRDFTVNATALDLETSNKRQGARKKRNLLPVAGRLSLRFVDPFGGKKDLKNKIIRAVGNPEERFNEDALRMLRAIRFATTLNFKIEEKTAQAIKKKFFLAASYFKRKN